MTIRQSTFSFSPTNENTLRGSLGASNSEESIDRTNMAGTRRCSQFDFHGL